MTNTARQQIFTLLTAEYPTRLNHEQIARRIERPESTVRRETQVMERDGTIAGYVPSFGRIEWALTAIPSSEAVNSARRALGMLPAEDASVLDGAVIEADTDLDEADVVSI